MVKYAKNASTMYTTDTEATHDIRNSINGCFRYHVVLLTNGGIRLMNVRTYVKRAYEADALSRDQLRNESNAFHHLLGQIEYLADVSMLDGHQKRNWGTHVIKRLNEILEDVKAGKAEGRKQREVKE